MCMRCIYYLMTNLVIYFAVAVSLDAKSRFVKMLNQSHASSKVHCSACALSNTSPGPN